MDCEDLSFSNLHQNAYFIIHGNMQIADTGHYKKSSSTIWYIMLFPSQSSASD